MKKLLSYIKNSAFLPICAGIAAIQPQLSAQIQELYFNDVTDNDSTYINNPVNWYTDAAKTTPYEGALDGNQNGNIIGTGVFTTKAAAKSNPIFNNLTYDISGISTSNSDFLVVGDNNVVNTKNDLNTIFSFLNDASYSSQLTYSIKLWRNAEIKIDGDWIIDFKRNDSLNYLELSIDDADATWGSENIHVGGNLISAGDVFILSTNNQVFTVDGVVDLGGSQWNLTRTHNAVSEVTRTVGGFGGANGALGTGRLNITTDSKEMTVNLVLKNKTTCDFSTSFAKNATSLSHLNIVMMAEDSANGRQIMRIGSTTSYWCNNLEVTNADIDDVEVNSGRLDLGMHYDMKGGNLQIYSHSGKTSDAIFSATSLMSGNEIGRAQFDSMTFYNGTIVFDLGEVENDFIQINGGVTRLADDAKLVFDITLSAEDLKVYLDLLGEEMMQWDIMSFKTDDSNIVADDIILKTQSGVEGTLDFIADASSGMTTVKLELAMVPEPAAFAGLLGAAALLLAIRRRRK